MGEHTHVPTSTPTPRARTLSMLSTTDLRAHCARAIDAACACAQGRTAYRRSLYLLQIAQVASGVVRSLASNGALGLFRPNPEELPSSIALSLQHVPIYQTSGHITFRATRDRRTY